MASLCLSQSLCFLPRHGLGSLWLPARLPALAFPAFAMHKRAFKLSPILASTMDSPPQQPSKTPPPKKKRNSQYPPHLREVATPDPLPPNYFLWAAGFCLLYITRRAVAAELLQWATIAILMVLNLIHLAECTIGSFLQCALRVLDAPLAFVLTLLGWSVLFTRDVYSVIVSTTAVWPTLKAISLSTIVFSLAEATRSTAVSGQQGTLLIVTLLGLGAAIRIVHHTVFVLLLLLLVGFSLLVQKKDVVSAFMPVTAVLVAVAEPSLKAVALVLFLALTVYHHWKTPEADANLADNKRIVQPTIAVLAAMVLGITVASQYIHHTQIRWLAK